MPNNKLTVYEWKINPDDDELGMTSISLVDKPAMESEYVAFNKEKKIYQFKDEKKRIVAGLALIPDKLIYRINPITEEEYLAFMSAETIEQIRDKFMNDVEKGVTKDVNYMHEANDKVNAYLVESFIIRTPELLEAVQKMGIEEAIINSWFVGYKFKSIEDYNKAISEDFTGFSVEMFLERELVKNNSNIKNNNIMPNTKLNNFIKNFISLVNNFDEETPETPEITDTPNIEFEDIQTEDETLTIRYTEVGAPVLIVDGENTSQAEEGEYIIKGGKTLIVDAEGNLTEIKDTEVTPVTSDELDDDVDFKVITDVASLIKEDGNYSIKFELKEGKFETAEIDINENQLKEDFDAQKLKINALNAEILKLKKDLEKPVSKSTLETPVQAKPNLSTKEKSKMSNLELTLDRLNIK